ncbi:uncharacterized protein LOC121428071 isoform X2 [Lytechinus variegatus]|uniref:uncharacterized protein LOC121428071 isoform X2 n=1 Tax=Lytechinus variegatus TaxID=7654 RepID=UPI001BB1E3E0|nr:uncharacterized protein LOC121428071 isoform X2 [Lytechinus variegatus]
MVSRRLSSFLCHLASILLSTSCVRGYDEIVNVTAIDVEKESFTLKWEWVVDDSDDFYPWGCQISVHLRENMEVVHEVEIEGMNTSYAVGENLTHWELYVSCITPILTNDTAIIDGDVSTCSDTIQTKYDPWTGRAQLAVIVTGGLIFMVIIAQLINLKWPRDQKRTFTIDDLDDDGDDGKPEPVDLDNYGFEQDEDATSSVNDWNAAATAAVIESKGGKPRGDIKQWVKQADVHHKSMRYGQDLSQDKHQSIGIQPGIHQPVGDDVNGNTVGSVEEGVAASEQDNYHLRYQQVSANQEVIHLAYGNPDPHQPSAERIPSDFEEPSYQDQVAYQMQDPPMPAHQIQDPSQVTHRPQDRDAYEEMYQNHQIQDPSQVTRRHHQEPEAYEATYQNQRFSNDYGNVIHDDGTSDQGHRNYGYDYDSEYDGYEQTIRQYPRESVMESQYDTALPSFDDDYARYF